MDALLERYNRLSDYVKELSILGVKRAREKLPDQPSDKQREEFEKKLVRAEKKQEEVDQTIALLRRKRDVTRDITNHALFPEAQKNAGFMKTYNGCKNKLDKYTWGDDDQLTEGKPIMTDIGKINTDHLEKLWADFVASKQPKKMMLNKSQFETYVITAKKNFEQFMPIFQKTKGATDKLEAWTSMENELSAKLAEEDATVDVGPMELIRNELGALIPKQPKPAKCPGGCRGKGKVVNGPYCQDCSTDYWAEVYENMIKRAKLYKRQVLPGVYDDYEQTLLSDFQEAHAYFEEKDGKKGWSELEKIYKKIDKLLPPLEEDSSVPKYALVDKLPNDYESEIDDDEEEEEYSDESSVSERPSKVQRGRRKRGSDSLGEVLNIFSGINSHIGELRKVYEQDGDSSEFENKLKKIKESFVERYKVNIYFKDDGRHIPFVPAPFIFYSRDDAIARGEEVIKNTEPTGSLRYEIEVLKPGH